MQGLLKLSAIVDRFNALLGRGLTYLILLAVLISASNAIVRKIFSWSSNSFLEVQWYLFATVFMLGGAYGFLRNAHVRIDFLSHHMSARTRNWIDVIGIIVFLLPFCYLMVDLSWPTFQNAWDSGEMSQNAGGLIRWPVYLLIPAGFSLLGLQGISELIKRLGFIFGASGDVISHLETESADEIGHEIEEHAAHADEEIR
ncbi:MAG: TRAP transporter small permease subunit [Burkholderiaceae bacterium]|nr:TRAP transporter small permease subunit [Sulfuritalea sp.]MCF8174598.1 TRAP transporter small permease subunit [Burkholderiaceae bacterium]MCF8184219.1 TRAP transporter small permease subunit [Polynucleobacter sp.]